MAYWFRQRYQLPPLDPRFLDMTPEDIETEWLAHQMASGAMKNEIEDESYDEVVADLEREAVGVNGDGDEMEEVINDVRS